MKRSARSRIIGALALLLLAVFAFSVWRIISQLTQEKRAEQQFEELAELVRAIEAEQTANTERRPTAPAATDARDAEAASSVELPAEPELLPQLAPLYERNSDLFGWVRIPDTPIDYPVMYTPEDPEHYLRRGFDGKYLYNGVPFLDGACDPNGNHLIVYGHHMKNETMFGTLPEYSSAEYCSEHPVILFDTLYEQREYEVMAAFYAEVPAEPTPDMFLYYRCLDLSDPESFASYVENVKKLSRFDSGVTADWGDELLTLSTCSYHTENGRFVVVAKRVR